MPAWWGRKSSKLKEDQIYHPNTSLFNELNHSKSHFNSEFNDNICTNNSNIRCPGSLEQLATGRKMYAVLPLSNNCNVRGSYGGGGCSSSGNVELDGEGKVVGHPLPRPITSTTTQYGSTELGSEEGRMCAVLPVLNDVNSCQDINGVVDQGHGVGSASVSSVSSCGSISNEPTSLLDHIQSGNFSGKGKSPGPGSRAATAATSPIYPRLAGLNLVSPTQREEEGSNQGHPLPLPPSSPTSPLSPPNGRSGAFTESTCNSQSKWKKGRLLGRGTFGHVYLGFNSEDGHMCAIKEVRDISDDQNSKEPLKQLNQEINFLSQLSHPNIVRYYGSDLAGDTLSVYLEFVSGGSIHKLLQEYGPFKEPVIQNYTRQILSGLAYLHSKTTVHRDIKGANILVHPTGEIKLADFGMAKHITSCNSVLSFKGSPYWMAPEIVVNKNGYNLAVDIWSLGCTILEMALAKPPWSQYEGVAAIFKIGNSKEIPEIPDFLSNDCKNFLHLCLKRDPADRPLASELLDHPFVKGQSGGRALNFNPGNDAVSFSSDERRKPEPLDIDPRRKSISSYDTDQMRKPGLTIWEPRDNRRSITSLPVSPSSSPLHRRAPISCPARPKQLQFKQSFNMYNKKTRRIHT